MIELDRGDVLEPIADKRVQLGIASGYQAPIHQWKGIVGKPGAGAGDKPAGGDCQPDEQNHALNESPPTGSCTGPSRATNEVKRGPKDQAVDGKRQGEMGNQAVLTDFDPMDEPAFDHVPAEQSLAKAKRQYAEQGGNQSVRQAPAQPKPDQWDGIGEPDQPTQQPVRIFPEIDAFELG